MATRLFVGNLAWETAEDTLRHAFEEDGRSVRDVHVVMDPGTGRPRGFAFVEMGSEDDAREAIRALDGTELDGRPIRVDEATAREPRRNGGGLRLFAPALLAASCFAATSTAPGPDPARSTAVETRVLFLVEDLVADTFEVPLGSTVYVADGVSVQASRWIHVAGTLETLRGEPGPAPGGRAADGGTISLSCAGPVYVSGTVRTSDGAAGSALTPHGGHGGTISIECPILVVDGRIETGSGAAGAEGGDGGNGGDLYFACFEHSATVASRTSVDTPTGSSWHLVTGDGGRAGDGTPERPARDVRAGRGGDLHVTDPDGAVAAAWGLLAGSTAELDEVLLASGLPGPWLVHLGVEVGPGAAADRTQDVLPLATSPGAPVERCRRGRDGRDGERASLGRGGQGAHGTSGTASSPNGNEGGPGGDGGNAYGFDRFDGKDGGHATDCCGEHPSDGERGGNGGVAGYLYGGHGGDGGPGGSAYVDPATGQWLGNGGNGGGGGRGGNGSGGDGGSAGDGGDGLPSGGPAGLEQVGAVGLRGEGGNGGLGGQGLVPGGSGPLGGSGTQHWGSDGVSGIDGATCGS